METETSFPTLFTVEVDVSFEQNGSRWEAMRPSHSNLPYVYLTRDAADSAARKFYLDSYRLGLVRVGKQNV